MHRPEREKGSGHSWRESETQASWGHSPWAELGDPPAKLRQHLPVPIPPETEYSVLAPITVDRVGINRHLERDSL